MKLAAVKCKRKQTEVAGTYNIMWYPGSFCLARVRAVHLNGLESKASSQKKNTLSINKKKCTHLPLDTLWLTRRLSEKGFYHFPCPYALLFVVTARKDQQAGWFHLTLWLFLHRKNQSSQVLLIPSLNPLGLLTWQKLSGEMRTQRGCISALLIS